MSKKGKILWFTELYLITARNPKKANIIRFTLRPSLHWNCNYNYCEANVPAHLLSPGREPVVKASLTKEKTALNQEILACQNEEEQNPEACVTFGIQQRGNLFALTVNGLEVAGAIPAFSEAMAAAFRTIPRQAVAKQGSTKSG